MPLKNENNRLMCQQIIQYFNWRCMRQFDNNSDKNLSAVEPIAELEPIESIKKRIDNWKTTKKSSGYNVCAEKTALTDMVQDLYDEMKVEEVIGDDAKKRARLSNGLQVMAEVVTEMMARTNTEEIKKAVIDSATAEIMRYLTEQYGPIKKRINIELPDRKVELEGVVHEKFDEILKCVKDNIPVFLTGPAGSGKNYLCKQIADTLGLKFYFSNAVTQEYKITGFTDANGTYHESQFYKAFKNGGLFMLDEMDASLPEVMVTLNAAIENHYNDFPAPIGYVEAHPDFRIVAAGNTYGLGADYEYVGRNQLDGATLNRFVTMPIEYDPRIEEAVSLGNRELLSFCRAFRKAASEAGIKAIVSYRNISQMAKLDTAMPTQNLLESCLIKALSYDDLVVLEDKLKEGYGKYSEGYSKLLARKKELVMG